MDLPTSYKAVIRAQGSPIGKISDVDLVKPGKNQVLVKMHFAPINPSDLMNLQGAYDGGKGSDRIGFEGAGEVVGVGEELVNKLEVGDKVCLTAAGTWAEYVIGNSQQVHKIPPGIDLQQAACYFVNPATVVYMSFLVKKSEHKAVIHTSGSSALGRMMNRYFKQEGIKLINIVRKQEYVDQLIADGAEYVLNSNDENFEKKLADLASELSATICFEAIAGEFTAKVINAMPNGSICHVYGSLSLSSTSSVNVGDLIFKNKTLTGLWLNNFFATAKLEEMISLMGKVFGNLLGSLKSNIQKVFTIEELDKAVELYAKNSSEGKILLVPK